MIPPDGMVDLNDIAGVVDRFVGLPSSPPVYRVDLLGPASGSVCLVRADIELPVDFDDIAATVDAFRVLSYFFVTGYPVPCPWAR